MIIITFKELTLFFREDIDVRYLSVHNFAPALGMCGLKYIEGRSQF